MVIRYIVSPAVSQFQKWSFFYADWILLYWTYCGARSGKHLLVSYLPKVSKPCTTDQEVIGLRIEVIRLVEAKGRK